MKRSQIFLGTTTCILAIAGVAAAKVSRFDTVKTRYFCTTDVHLKNYPLCVSYTGTTYRFTPTGTRIAKATIAGGIYTLYVTKVASKPTCGTLNNPSGSCSAVLTYDMVN
jgi:hypothetical protein